MPLNIYRRRRGTTPRFTDLLDVFDKGGTFTRASDGYYNNASKFLQVAASNIPRYDHDPINGDLLGLLSTSAYTNLCIYSEDMSVWTTNGSPTVAKDATSPRGTANDAYTFESSAAFAGKYRTFSGIAASTKYIISGLVKNISGAVNVKVGADSAVFNTGQVATINVNASTGVITGTSGGVTDSGIYTRADGWHQWWIEATTDAAVSSFAFVSYNTNASASKNAFFGNMIVASDFLLPYVATNGSAATSATDRASVPTVDFGFNEGEGTFRTRIKLIGVNATQDQYIISIRDSGVLELFYFFYDVSTGRIRFSLSTGGVNQVDIWSPATYAAGEVLDLEIGWKVGKAYIKVGGVVVVTGAPAALPSGLLLESMYISNLDSGSSPLQGTMAKLNHSPSYTGE